MTYDYDYADDGDWYHGATRVGEHAKYVRRLEAKVARADKLLKAAKEIADWYIDTHKEAGWVRLRAAINEYEEE